MSAGNLQQIGERLKSERARVGLSQVALADACGVNRGTLATWEKGEQGASAQILFTMAEQGIDVLFVVTGKRSNESEATLAPAERALLQAWRESGEKGRALLSAAAEVLKPE